MTTLATMPAIAGTGAVLLIRAQLHHWEVGLSLPNLIPTFLGCQIDCRLIGVLLARQKEKNKQFQNDRTVAVA